MSTTVQTTPPSAAFELRAGPFSGRDLDVVELRGREGLSRLYAFEILTVTRAPSAEVVAALLGRPAHLSIHAGGGAPRVFSGIVSAVAPEGARAEGGAVGLTVRLVPRLWLLRRRTASRIFQDQTVKDIVSAVLAGLDVPCAFRLRRAPAPKEYCVQYEETDYEFVTRLLAEEGIYFFFEPAAEGATSDVVVFGDDDAYAPIEGSCLSARTPDGLRAPDDFVADFSVRREIRPKAVLLKDFDPENPRYDCTSSAEHGQGDRAAGIEPASLRVYQHGGHYGAPEISSDKARAVLEQLRRRATVARGEGRSVRLAAGKRFSLTEHPLDEHNRDYLVTRVDHKGRAPERLSGASAGAEDVYRNTFECVPAEVVYRPRRPRRRPRQVLETAVVVGAAGEEVYTDALGRIKVQFHWDLDGRHDGSSSCWVPVSQAWAGSGWGFQFVPRIGMEVLVSFLGGDTDKPIVTGCLMSPLTPPTHPLPGHATRSGVRTRTVPGPDGHNELSFEDRRGQEVVHVHAQRNMDVVVRQDQTTTIGRSDDVEPRGDQRTTVAANQSISVGGSRALRVGADLEEQVRGSRSEHVVHHASRHVEGSVEDRCDGTLTQAIGRSHVHRVDGSLASDVGRDVRLHVGGDRGEIIRGSTSLTVSGDVGRAVQGSYAVTAAGGVVLTSGESIRLVCGDSMIELGPGEITLSSRVISVLSAESATFAAPRASLHLEKKRAEIHADEARIFGKGAEIALGGDAVTASGRKSVELFGRGASVLLETDAAMDGATVKLNCAGGSGGHFEAPDEGEESFIDVALTHKTPRPGDPTQLEDAPVPGARFVVEASDGRRFRGVLDGQGRARVPVPRGPAKVSFPDYDAGRVKPA
jgi:type VI secretion system secreted protein VgrG